MRTPERVHALSVSLVLFIILAHAAFAQAETGTVSGAVLSSDTGEPIPGAELYLPSLEVGTITSKNGSFTLSEIPLGKHSLEVHSLGFESQHVIFQIHDGVSEHLTILLKPSFLEIQELLIEGSSLIGGQRAMQSLPGSAHRLSPRAISKFQHSDVNRILREVPGLNIVEEDGYGLRPNIGIRGTGAERSSKISLMEDGVLIAPAPYSAPAAYYFPTIGRMSGIEVRKGSSQIKYGPYTTGGALNLLSVEIPNSLSGKIRAMTGNDDNMTLHAFAGSGFDNGGFVFETYQEKTDGFKRLDLGGDTGFEKTDYLGKIRLNTNSGSAVYQSMELKYSQTSETSNETYLGLTETDFDRTPMRRYAGSRMDEMSATHQQWTLRHTVRPSDWLQINSFAYRNTFARNWYKLSKVKAAGADRSVSISSLLANPDQFVAEYNAITGNTNSPDNILSVKANNRTYVSRGFQTSASVEFQALGQDQNFEVGVRLHYDEMDRFQWVDDYSMSNGLMTMVQGGTPGTESNRIESANAISGFGQFRLQVGQFVVMPGIRYEHIDLARKDYGKSDPERMGASIARRSNTVDVLIPGVGISYQLSPVMTIFGGLHKGFSPPGSKENTNPEESFNYELGARIKSGLLHADATVFFHDYSNLLGADLAASGGGGTTDQFNGGEVNVSGLEFSLSSNLGSYIGWQFSIPVTATYTMTSAAFQSDFESSFEPWGTVSKDDHLPYVPMHQGTVGLGLEVRSFDVSLSASYAGVMRTVAGSGSPNSNERIDARIVLDVSGSYSVWRNVRLFATIRNVTDSVYVVARRPAGLRPGLPRTTLIGVSASF